MNPLRLPRAVVLLALACLAGGARAADPAPARTLLVEVRDIPAKEQAKGGRFDYSDYNRVALLSIVRNTAQLLATRAEFDALQHA